MRKKGLIFLICFFLFTAAYANINNEYKNKCATSLSVVNYARTLLLSIVESEFRGSWVIDSENLSKLEEKTRKLQKSFESLAQVKIGMSQKDVLKILKTPLERRNTGKVWVYGKLNDDGTYNGLTEVFFDGKGESVIAVISFDPNRIVENIGVNIGDQIDKMIAAYGEPVDEKDFIEDPDNKEYLGLYYLYPRSGIGFLIGQDKASKNLLVHGVLVYGKH